MARKAGQGEEEEKSRARQQAEEMPARHEEEKMKEIRVILMIFSLYWYLEMLTDLFQAPKTSSEFGCMFSPYGTNLNPHMHEWISSRMTLTDSDCELQCGGACPFQASALLDPIYSQKLSIDVHSSRAVSQALDTATDKEGDMLLSMVTVRKDQEE
ncbi:hypothetical protein STEG23_000349 [Scotinomys teguina]